MTEQPQPDGPPPRTASAILSAAETLAEEIRERAHADANAIRARAGSDSEAAQLAVKGRLQRLSALADEMFQRLGEMRVELDALSASLDRPPAVPARALEDKPPAVAAGAPEHGLPAVAVPAREDGRPAVAGPAPGRVQPVAAVPEPDGAPAAAGVSDASAARIDDAGARLIALNLALSDTPRDEAARQLRDQVPDPEGLVDEVYASVDR